MGHFSQGLNSSRTHLADGQSLVPPCLLTECQSPIAAGCMGANPGATYVRKPAGVFDGRRRGVISRQ